MKNSKQQTQSSLRSRHNYIRIIAITGLLVALSVVIGWLCKTYLTFGVNRITFENTPVFISGMVYGPIVGIIVGVLSDIISCLISPNPSLNPIITLGAGVIGALSGIIPRYIIKNGEKLKIWVTVFFSHIIGSMIIKSIGLYVSTIIESVGLHGFFEYGLEVLVLFFKYGLGILAGRILLYIGIAVCESIIIYAILKNKNIKKMLGK